MNPITISIIDLRPAEKLQLAAGSSLYRIIGAACAIMQQRISPLKPRQDMSSSRRYITNEQGERIGVVLDLDEYQQMTRQLLRPDASDPEILIGLSEAELQALAHSTPLLRNNSASMIS